ncbi:unnamed protein product [Choristocarpus tenellus]
MIRESTLLQVVCSYLRNDSLMDIVKRRELYLILFGLTQHFSTHELLAPLIDSVPNRRPQSAGSKVTVGVSEVGSQKEKGKGKSTVPLVLEEDGGVEIVMGKEEEKEEFEEEEVSVADLLASADRQAKVYTSAPLGTTKGKGKRNSKEESDILGFALQASGA